MGPSRFTQYGGATGAEDALKQLVMERYAAQMEAQKQAQIQIENEMRHRQISQGDRRMDIEQDQFGQTHELNVEKQTQDVRQFDALAPQRDAQAGYLRTQSRHMEETPMRETAERAHEEKMANLQGAIRTGHINRQGQVDAGLIGQRQQDGASGGAAVSTGNITADYTDERSTRLKDSLASLEPKINKWTTGWGNYFFGKMPETEALNFESELDSLRANVAFKELTEMRAASKTGGALGQVSNIELQLLQSALGALNPRQGAQNLREQFQKIGASIDRWEQAKAQHGMGGAAAPTQAETPYQRYLKRSGQ
jgi:hypothetical protein